MMKRYTPTDHCPDCFQPGHQDSACTHCGYESGQAVEGVHYLAPFTQLHGGRYLVGRILGQPGAYGVVYAGWHCELAREVAIKEFFPAASMAERDSDRLKVVARPGSEELFAVWRQRFLDEARLLAEFDHSPRIVQVRDVFQQHGSAYLVMERLRGESLAQRLNLIHGESGLRARATLTTAEAEVLLLALLDALQALHQKGVLHRDISPANLYLQGGSLQGLTLLDFGLAQPVGQGPVDSGSAGLGTPGFTAPEQLSRDGQALAPYTDLYSLGAVLYLALGGRVPPDVAERSSGIPLTPLYRLRPDLPSYLAELVDACLHLDPARRPRSVAELRERLSATTLTPQGLADDLPGIGDTLGPQGFFTAADEHHFVSDKGMRTSSATGAGAGYEPLPTIIAERDDTAGSNAAAGFKRKGGLWVALLLLLALAWFMWPYFSHYLEIVTGGKTSGEHSIPKREAGKGTDRPGEIGFGAVEESTAGGRDDRNGSATDNGPASEPAPSLGPVSLPASEVPPAIVVGGAPESSSANGPGNGKVSPGANDPPVQQEGGDIVRRQAEAERRAAEGRRQAEAESRAKEARRQAEVERRVKEAKRQAEVERRAKEARRQAEVERRAKEARRQAEVERRAEEARRQAEAERRAEEARRQAEVERRAEEARRQAEAERRAEEARRQAEAERRAEEARRQAEAERRAEEARRQAEAERRAEEAWRQAETERRAEAARRLAEAGRQAEAERQAEARRKTAAKSSEARYKAALEQQRRYFARIPDWRRIQALLAQLDFDFDQGHFIMPFEANLLMDYHLLREFAPDHPRLHDVFWQLVWFFDDAMEESLEVGEIDRATALLWWARHLDPGMRRWGQVQADLEELRSLDADDEFPPGGVFAPGEHPCFELDDCTPPE